MLNEPNPYRGQYNSPFYNLFLPWLDHNLDAILKTARTTRKPVFIFLIAADDS
jgi:hypothetical protein